MASEYLNMDCMEGMKEYPDNYFDLAIVDPPFGDAGQPFKRSDKKRFGERFDRYKEVDDKTVTSPRGGYPEQAVHGQVNTAKKS